MTPGIRKSPLLALIAARFTVSSQTEIVGNRVLCHILPSSKAGQQEQQQQMGPNALSPLHLQLLCSKLFSTTPSRCTVYSAHPFSLFDDDPEYFHYWWARENSNTQ